MAGSTQPHLVLVPWMGGLSHIMPMTDIGCLVASHGAPVTIITTPANAPVVQSRVDRATAHGAGGTIVTVTAIPFPAADAGLPEGIERLDLLRSPADVPRFFTANKLFGKAVARYCRDGATMPRRPSCVVAGMCHTWALGVARDLGVPCYIFHGFGAFALLCIERLFEHRTHEKAADDDEVFEVPALPPPLECRVSRRQLPPHFSTSTSMGGGTLREVRDFEVAVDGIVVNSFEEMERGSASLLARATGKKVLAVGPVSLCVPPSSLTDDNDARRCMAWLDAKDARSVVYVSFGSAGRMPSAQVLQLGKALVACPWPVFWVLKGADSLSDDGKEWLRANTDDAGKCLVVRGWAPQVAILAHPAVGGFLTHCGWGSTLEAVAAGVAMATWPLFAEQFLNERLIVDVLGVGVSVGVTKPTENILTASGKREPDAEVGTEQVLKALERLMDRGAEGEERRRRVWVLKDMAQGALEKGGSSYLNLDKLIQSSV